MYSVNLYQRFGQRLIIIAIIEIFSLFISLINFIYTNILQRFGLFPFNITITSFLSIISFIGWVVWIVFTFLLLSSINQLKYEAKNIHFSQFYSKLLVAIILKIVIFVYTIIASVIYGNIADLGNFEMYILGSQLINILGNVFSFISSLIALNAWAHFLRFSKMQELPANVVQAIGLIKFSVLLGVISIIVGFFEQIIGLLYFFGFPIPTTLYEIIIWTFFIGDGIFLILNPTVSIIGNFRLGKSIQFVRFSSSSEPVLDGQSAFIERTDIDQNQNRTICSNCGSYAPKEATFCPNCGSHL